MSERNRVNRGKEIATGVSLDILALGGMITAVAEQTSSNPVSQAILRVAENITPVQSGADMSAQALGTLIASTVVAAASIVFFRRARRA